MLLNAFNSHLNGSNIARVGANLDELFNATVFEMSVDEEVRKALIYMYYIQCMQSRATHIYLEVNLAVLSSSTTMRACCTRVGKCVRVCVRV